METKKRVNKSAETVRRQTIIKLIDKLVDMLKEREEPLTRREFAVHYTKNGQASTNPIRDDFLKKLEFFGVIELRKMLLPSIPHKLGFVSSKKSSLRKKDVIIPIMPINKLAADKLQLAKDLASLGDLRSFSRSQSKIEEVEEMEKKYAQPTTTALDDVLRPGVVDRIASLADAVETTYKTPFEGVKISTELRTIRPHLQSNYGGTSLML